MLTDAELEAIRRNASPVVCALLAELDRLEDALVHAVHRNHEPSAGCDGCVRVTAVMAELLPRGAVPVEMLVETEK
jgi:hypothetical protein